MLIVKKIGIAMVFTLFSPAIVVGFLASGILGGFKIGTDIAERLGDLLS